MANATAGRPATLEIDYPDRELDRLTTLVRLITVIPIAIVLGLVMGASPDANSGTCSHHHVFAAGGFVSAATALMLVFRQKYPRWWLPVSARSVRVRRRHVPMVTAGRGVRSPAHDRSLPAVLAVRLSRGAAQPP
jgi:hypothetical protein